MVRQGKRFGLRPVLALGAIVSLLLSLGPDAIAAHHRAALKPNFLIILMDDQRIGTDEAMPQSTASISDVGVRFENAMVPLSMCCPSRASILTGNYPHTTGVWGNKLPRGGFAKFDDSSTLSTWLQGAGYRTGLFGKYLNEYGIEGQTDYVPPGWDTWAAYYGSESYTDFAWIDENATITQDSQDYASYFFENKTIDFINSTPSGTPFFAYFAPPAPHAPATPAPEDASLFSDLPLWRPPSYNEADVTDKPPYIQAIHRFGPNRMATIDAFRQDQYRSMYSADRAISWILTDLQTVGRLTDTVIVFMSDNGFLWGEHRLFGKDAPYDASIRIPLAIRYDAAGWTGSRIGIVANVDIAPTLADLAGLTETTDGVSLVPILNGAATSVRGELVMESAGGGGKPAYCGVRTRQQLFVHYADGFEEYYNYRRDPDELTNHAAVATRIVARLREDARTLCSPTPPGFAW